MGRDEHREGVDDEADETTGDDTVTRRTFLRTTGASAAAAGSAVAATEGVDAQAQTYRFGGEVPGWQGREPSAVRDSTNPPIELQAGTDYEFWFENIDGEPHNMTIQDDAGSTIVQSELISEQGATASVTFTATSAMSTYICTIHPTTMVGDLDVAGQVEGGDDGDIGLSFRSAALIVSLLIAFISPVLFAIFLFRQRRGGGETTARA